MKFTRAMYITHFVKVMTRPFGAINDEFSIKLTGIGARLHIKREMYWIP